MLNFDAMWIIITVIFVFVLARALNKSSKKTSWTEKDNWAQLDEDLDDV